MRSLTKASFALRDRGMMNVPAERSLTFKGPGNETAPQTRDTRFAVSPYPPRRMRAAHVFKSEQSVYSGGTVLQPGG